MQKKITPTEPAKINLRNIKKFLQGWTRYIYYLLSKNKFAKKVGDSLNLLPSYKQEQFNYRLQVMNKECLTSGHCVICGCGTPELQMADEACEGKCYPEMMEEKEWVDFKINNNIKI